MKTKAKKAKKPVKRTKEAAPSPVAIASSSVNNATPEAHQWTNGGSEVLLLKCVGMNGESHNGFKWPLTVGAEVKPETWSSTPNCESGGLFGWPWGLSLGDGKDPEWTGNWIVFGAAPADVVRIEGKAKARIATVRFVGNWNDALSFILPGQMNWVHARSRGAASSTGDSGAASSTGSRGAASSTGDSGAASSTGYRGAASSTGDSGAAQSTGLYCKARGGKYGCIALAWWNQAEKRQEMRCARIGCGDGSDGTLKANQWYQLNDSGDFVELN